ncbi:MAG: hypothetical protein GF421_01890 [Candidatus Aminicenantes bacterium]|nr:hypothetical protein [Candidatus Aminicenantes bacterium]
MEFYFVKDFKKKYRFFSSQPDQQIQVTFTKWKKMWEEAKRRLMLLPPKILFQELAFERGIKTKESECRIYFAAHQNQSQIQTRFLSFLRKQRVKHIWFLAIETLFLPLSGLMAFLPGPNIFFYVLFLIMFTQWRALIGIKRLIHAHHTFVGSSLLDEWDSAVNSENPEMLESVIQKIEKKLTIKKIRKILYQ